MKPRTFSDLWRRVKEQRQTPWFRSCRSLGLYCHQMASGGSYGTPSLEPWEDVEAALLNLPDDRWDALCSVVEAPEVTVDADGLVHTGIPEVDEMERRIWEEAKRAKR